jgi:hypothetical protein
MRRPQLLSERGQPTGHVAHDDRGNAFWQWAEDVVSEPMLATPSLEISDDTSDSRIESVNTGRYVRVAGKGGYNPYESVPGRKAEPPRKRDLKALSKWIEQRRGRGEPTKL